MEWDLVWELFHFAILAALLAGIVCPLVGCFLLVRRTGFYGVTLPQFATAGVALGYLLLPWWIANVGLGDMDLTTALGSPHALKTYLVSWAAVCTFGGLLALGSGRGGSTEPARVAASFAIASTATILFSLAAPTGGEFVEFLLHGEILVIGLHEFETIAAVYLAVLVLFVVYHQDLLLVSYDRDTAIVQGKGVRRYEALLTVLVGLTVSVGALIVGPIVLFGLLVIPPLAARSMARSMLGFYVLAATLGGVASLGGIALSFGVDWPLGPSVVVVAAAELLLPLTIRWRRSPAGAPGR